MDNAPSSTDAEAFAGACKRLAAGEPVQYVCGRAPFRDLELKVDPRVLIPRPETEQLVQLALDHPIPPDARILDVGTGSGCIALALKKARPDCQVTGLDISAEALDLARENAQDLQLAVCFKQADLLQGQPFRTAEIIIANLPYIGENEADALPAEVRDFEPHLALFSGPDGSDLILRLLQEAKEVLTPEGTLFLETGETQSDIWQTAADQHDWHLQGHKDLADRPRFWIFTPKSKSNPKIMTPDPTNPEDEKDDIEEEERTPRIREISLCPCKSKKSYAECCLPFHYGRAQPETAEQLMRARYCAFFFRRVDYLISTTHATTREWNLKQQLEASIHDYQWTFLNILQTSKGGPDDKTGKVEFIAHFYHNGEAGELHEHSRFTRSKGMWKYLDGKG